MSDLSRALVLLVPLLAPSTLAEAHGQIPATLSVQARRNGTGDQLLMGVSFGALLSADRGASWRWICEESIGYRSGSRPAFIYASDGAIWAPTFEGLLVSRDGGCSWQLTPTFGTNGVSDIEPHPTEPATLWVTALTSSVSSAIYSSTNSGQSFELGMLATDHLLLSSVRVAPSHPARIYAAGSWYSPRTANVYRSDNGGQTWTSTAQSFADPGVLAIVMIDPSNADLVYARVGGVQADYLVRSEDAGRSFATVSTMPDGFRSIVASDDGATVWLSSTDHLYRSNDRGKTFAMLPSPTRNSCVDREGGTIYACGWQFQDGFSLAQSTDNGNHFTPLFSMVDIRGVIDCPAGTTTHDLCTGFFPILAATIGIPLDGGPSSDAGATADGGEQQADAMVKGPPEPSSSKKCGCTGTSGETTAQPLVLLVLLGLLLLRTLRTTDRSRRLPR